MDPGLCESEGSKQMRKKLSLSVDEEFGAKSEPGGQGAEELKPRRAFLYDLGS